MAKIKIKKHVRRVRGRRVRVKSHKRIKRKFPVRPFRKTRLKSRIVRKDRWGRFLED